MNENEIIYLKDSEVDEEMNKQLIHILSLCFNDQPVFQNQRYFKELPQHRWIIRDQDLIIAHVAVHDKNIESEKGSLRIGGIAEVCIHPDFRGRGLVKRMLAIIHEWLKERGFAFAMLYGDKNVYSSSGYVPIKNQIKYLDHVSQEWKTEESEDAMIAPINRNNWPDGLININGPTF